MVTVATPPAQGRQAIRLALAGKLDMSAFLAALRQLPDRHPSVFGEADSDHIDFSPDLPFDLAIGPLQVALTQQGPELHHLTCSLPSTLRDPCQFGALVMDIGRLYGASLLGEAPDPPSLPAAGNNPRHLPAPDPGILPFSAVEPSARLPRDRYPAAPGARSISTVVRPLAPWLMADLAQLRDETGASEYEICLAALAILVARFSGEANVRIGIDPAEVLASRDQLLCGSRGELSAMAVHVDMHLTGLQLLAAVRSGVAAAVGRAGYQGDPEPAAVEACADAPAFGFRFGASLPMDDAAFLGLGVDVQPLEVESVDSGESTLWLTMSMAVGQVEWRHDDALFDTRTIDGWIESYVSILASLAREAWSRVALVEAATERQVALITEWNEKPAAQVSEDFVHRSIAILAQVEPHRIAVLGPEESTDFRDLESAANRLARELLLWGAARGARVGVLLGPGRDLIVTHLAVLKSGAACVPLDTSASEDGLCRLVEFADLALVVTDERHAPLLRKTIVRTLPLDAEADLIIRRSGDPFMANDLSAGDPAYILFPFRPATGLAGLSQSPEEPFVADEPGADDAANGSGERSASESAVGPLGCVLSHRALAARVEAMRRGPQLGADDKVVAMTTNGASFCPVQPFAALCTGAAVVIVDAAADGRSLKRQLKSAQATVMTADAEVWQRLMGADWVAPPGFRAVLPAIQLTRSLAERLLESRADVWSFYGSSDATGVAAIARQQDTALLSDSPADNPALPIGTPSGCATIWVLDGNGAVCPIGVPGEIHVGGEGIAQGYLNRPINSADDFVADLVGPSNGQKFFRTGDIGRWCCDGRLELILPADLALPADLTLPTLPMSVVETVELSEVETHREFRRRMYNYALAVLAAVCVGLGAIWAFNQLSAGAVKRDASWLRVDSGKDGACPDGTPVSVACQGISR